MKQRDNAEKLLMYYYFWGFTAMLSYIVFAVFLLIASMAADVSMATIFAVLLAGFIWIGTTVISRHAFIILKQYIGKEVSMREFLSTQLVGVLFPLVYARLKREVAEFRKSKLKDA